MYDCSLPIFFLLYEKFFNKCLISCYIHVGRLLLIFEPMLNLCITVGNQRHHNEAFHQEDRTRHQCWHCNKTYARLETAGKHALKIHGDTEPSSVKLTSKNSHWTPEIKAPKPWIPPPEARPRTVHQIYIPTP